MKKLRKKIKMLGMDVDGTLTDGKINLGADGEVFKAFDIKDGYAIHQLLPQNSILPIIITGRRSQLVENRAKELGVNLLYQGINNKSEILAEIAKEHNVSWDEIAFIGDDMMDLECLKKCGASGCPADAVKQVKDACEFICSKPAGCGAVREFIEYLIEVNSTF